MGRAPPVDARAERARRSILLLPALVVLGCGGSRSDDAPDAPTAPSTTAPAPTAASPTTSDGGREPLTLAPTVGPCPADELAADLEAHSCFHLAHGSYADVATGAEGFAASVSTPHTAYTVSVTPGEERWLSFTSRRNSVYAFYSGPKTRIVVRRTDGRLVPLACEGETTDACPALPYQAHAKLGANEAVGVALFPDGPGPVRLVIEALE